jgi:hypothetical protein
MRPKVARSGAFDPTLICPHCSADMADATVRLEDLVSHLPLGGFVATGPDGYADGEDRTLVSCPACSKPSVLRIVDASVVLIAARTPADRRYLARGAA